MSKQPKPSQPQAGRGFPPLPGALDGLVTVVGSGGRAPTTPSVASGDSRGSVADVARLLVGRRAVALTGAGCSTESGIPDYRGGAAAKRARAPVRYQEFMARPEARRRYWARSMAGWPTFASARPNAAHRALADLERAGSLCGIITQNVDGLHQAAGATEVVELHGSLARVRCMRCGALASRAELQERLEAENPRRAPRAALPAPDGDADLDVEAEAAFRVPECERCGGILKPDVVFFGESVAGATLAQSWTLYESADVLLVLGSSLEVFSGRRFVLRATKECRPIVVVNLGPTRADEVAAFKIDGRLGEVVPHLADVLRSGAENRESREVGGHAWRR